MHNTKGEKALKLMLYQQKQASDLSDRDKDAKKASANGRRF
ncbi:MAG: hypothetical protein V1708_02480 [Candidatus Micrarchaeota archaeon]